MLLDRCLNACTLFQVERLSNICLVSGQRILSACRVHSAKKKNKSISLHSFNQISRKSIIDGHPFIRQLWFGCVAHQLWFGLDLVREQWIDSVSKITCSLGSRHMPNFLLIPSGETLSVDNNKTAKHTDGRSRSASSQSLINSIVYENILHKHHSGRSTNEAHRSISSMPNYNNLSMNYCLWKRKTPRPLRKQTVRLQRTQIRRHN